MIEKEENGIRWLVFELLEEELTHGVFLRHGGVSEQPFAGLNLSLSVGDDKERVAENTRRALGVLGIQRDAIRPVACHGNVVAVVDDNPPTFPCDGLVTDRLGAPLLVTHADCQVAILFDPVRKVLANVHCGWRGNVQNIYSNAIELMKAHYGVRPEDLLVGISPSLGPECAEFIHYKEEFPDSFWRHQVTPFHFDLWAISEEQLVEAGVLRGHIECARHCTMTHGEDFFSYRKERVCGRNAVIAYIK